MHSLPWTSTALPLSWSMYAISGAASRVLSETKTAPSRAVAKKHTKVSMLFGPRYATRSPAAIPSSLSTWAVASTLVASSV